MSTSSYDDRRAPVVYRGERVPGLYVRRDSNGESDSSCAAKWEGRQSAERLGRRR